MVNYANGKIYKIECLTTGLIYVGSTTKERLSQRLVQHREDYKRHLKGNYNYTRSFDILKNDNYRIELLEEVNCDTKDQLHSREGHYIRSLECVNKTITKRTKQEYHQDNKERLNNISKQYRETNKEKIAELNKTSYICECGVKYTYGHHARHIKSIRHQNFINSQI